MKRVKFLHFFILSIFSPPGCKDAASCATLSSSIHNPFQFRPPWEQSCPQEDAPIVSGRGDGGSRSCWLQERLSDHPDHHCLKRYSVYIIQSIVPSWMWSFLSLSDHCNHHFPQCISTKDLCIPITIFFRKGSVISVSQQYTESLPVRC